jgi:hypothetical protein
MLRRNPITLLHPTQRRGLMRDAMAGGSSLLCDEYFEAGDDRFLQELLRFDREKQLGSWADKMYNDKRPFARRVVLAYIDDGCDRDHHRMLVKKLFKRAEAAKDDEAMGHFMVAFDRLSLRHIYEYDSWDYRTSTPRKVFHLGLSPLPDHESGFSRATRHYLRRRAWRYFRFLGWKEPERYGRAIRAALMLYKDEHLAKSENLLDAWGLMHALYHGSKTLRRAPKGILLAHDASLAELQPAPFRSPVWMGLRDELLAMVEKARSRTVRAWTIAWLRQHYQLGGLPIARVRLFLRSPNEEVQVFGAELLKSAVGLAELPIADWMELLEIENSSALPLICELVLKHVSPARLKVEDCVKLAQNPAAPVAELGWKWLREKKGVGLDALVALGEATAPLVREEAVGWVIERIRQPEGKPEHLRELIDARHADVRERALTVMSEDQRFRDAETLWAALPESPYDDVRVKLVAHLEERLTAVPKGSLRHVWITSLLAVHRGGKAKPEVARQIARRIVSQPAEAMELLPLLGIALRSLRQPEKRAALAALVRAAEARPSLKAEIMKKLPELRILDDAATAKASQVKA